MTQFLKSTYYANSPELQSMKKPLFNPDPDSELRRQITERSVTILLDMWCFPLTAPDSAALFKLPLPVYADVPTAPGGTALLAVSSEAFFKWTDHLHMTARVLSPNPSAEVVTPDQYERPSGVRLPEPNLFYVEKSAHLSQSDFGILFPWLTKRIFSSVEPERALRLNLRAQLQLLRINNIPIARTWAGDLVDDLVDGTHVDKLNITASTITSKPEDGILDDKAIFERGNAQKVDSWVWIDTFGLGMKSEKHTKKGVAEAEETQVRVEEENMELEIQA
jgi:platelet-activating factor acetylhydrolase